MFEYAIEELQQKLDILRKSNVHDEPTFNQIKDLHNAIIALTKINNSRLKGKTINEYVIEGRGNAVYAFSTLGDQKADIGIIKNHADGSIVFETYGFCRFPMELKVIEETIKHAKKYFKTWKWD